MIGMPIKVYDSHHRCQTLSGGGNLSYLNTTTIQKNANTYSGSMMRDAKVSGDTDTILNSSKVSSLRP